MVTQEELKQRYVYDPETGHFFYATNRTRKRGVGALAGSRSKQHGYVLIGVRGRQYLAHRLAWLWMTGEFPSCDIDHADCDRSNNSWNNLRLATRSENMANSGARKNNSTGFKGVYRARSRYESRIQIMGQNVYLGRFDTKQEAADAYMKAAQKSFGQFARA